MKPDRSDAKRLGPAATPSSTKKRELEQSPDEVWPGVRLHAHRRDVDRCISTQAPAAKKKPTPPDQDDELELTGAELVALSEAADVLDAATSTASAIQRKAEEILGLNHGALKPKRAAIEKFMERYERVAFLKVKGELEALARAKLLQMQFEHCVTPDNFMTLEELRTSSPKTYAKIFAEVKHESLSGEDKFRLAKGNLAELKKRRPNGKQERSDASILRDKEKDAEFDKRMREEELRRAAQAKRTEALRQARIAEEAAAKAKEERREQEIKDRRERYEERAKGRELVLNGEDVPSKELSCADAEEKRPPPAPKRAPAPKRKPPAQVLSRRRTGGAFIQARHAVDATSSARWRGRFTRDTDSYPRRRPPRRRRRRPSSRSPNGTSA